MSSTFTPPAVAEVSPVGGDPGNPLGNRLFRFFSSRQRGAAVFKMSDGTYRIARAVPGLSVTVEEPYPAIVAGDVVNDALAWSWYAATGTEYGLGSPTVSVVYLGGHSYQVSSVEAADLTAAGFGAYLS